MQAYVSEAAFIKRELCRQAHIELLIEIKTACM